MVSNEDEGEWVETYEETKKNYSQAVKQSLRR